MNRETTRIEAVEFNQQRVEEALNLIPIGSFFIEAAVGTDFWTEGNVDVKVFYPKPAVGLDR